MALTQIPLETHSPVPVSEVVQDHDALVLHGIMHNSSVEANSMLMPGHSDQDTKIGVSLGFQPTLSASLVSPQNPDRRLWSSTGLIVVDGAIESAHDGDAATIAKGIRSREASRSNMVGVASVLGNMALGYNEVVVGDPKFGGMFWAPHYRGKKPDATTVPKRIIDSADKFGLPIYLIDENAQARPITITDPDGAFEAADPVPPAAIPRVEAAVDTAELQASLLERGVFRVASQERNLISSSENGRLAYYVEQPSAVDHLEDGDERSFHVTTGAGVSRSTRLQRINGQLTLETRADGIDGTARGEVERIEVDDLQDAISRVRYLPKMPWSGGALNPDMPSFSERTDMSNDYLDIVGRLAAAGQKVLEDDSQDEKMKQFIALAGHNLYGYADEAASNGDTELAARATDMAAKLLDRQAYDELRQRRLGADGSFKLTHEDLQ